MEQLARPKATRGCGDSRGLQGQGLALPPERSPPPTPPPVPASFTGSHKTERVMLLAAGVSPRTSRHTSSLLGRYRLIMSQKVFGGQMLGAGV